MSDDTHPDRQTDRQTGTSITDTCSRAKSSAVMMDTARTWLN